MNKNTSPLVFAVVSMIIGGAGGFFLSKYLAENGIPFRFILYFLLCFAVLHFPAIVIHEFGHMIMGMITGYKFLSFRVGSLVIANENGRLMLKKYTVPGTGGQCLLIPPETNTPEKLPFLLYHLGGVLLNLIFAAASAMPCLHDIGLGLKIPLAAFALQNSLKFLLNILPFSYPVSTDGRNALILQKSKFDRKALYIQLRYTGLLAQGLTPSQTASMLPDIGEPDKNSSFGYILNMIKLYQLLDNFRFSEAETICSQLLNDPHIQQIYLRNIKCELLFCKIVCGCEKTEIQQLYNDLKDYILSSEKYSISIKRLLFAYHCIFRNDISKAEVYFKSAENMKDSCPYSGEYHSEMNIISHLFNKNYNNIAK